jgi:hypothetical protein
MSSYNASAASVEGRTGEKCTVSGVYKCKTHTDNTIPLAIHNVFPPCSRGGGHSTTWVLVRRA